MLLANKILTEHAIPQVNTPNPVDYFEAKDFINTVR